MLMPPGLAEKDPPPGSLPGSVLSEGVGTSSRGGAASCCALPIAGELAL